jgi:Flp pilus assembly pilin Flp
MLGLLRDEKGNLTVEVLVVLMAVAAIAGAITGLLLPAVRDLHEAVKAKVGGINETGF